MDIKIVYQLFNRKFLSDSLMIPWKRSIESCERKKCVKKDIAVRQFIIVKDARDRLTGRDHHILIHLTIDDRRITRKHANARVRLKARVTQGQDLVQEIHQRVGVPRVVLIVQGKSFMIVND